MIKLKTTSFSGHDKFECKIDWITKGLKLYSEDHTIFSQLNIETSITKLGLGINMIRSLSHWMKVLGLIKDNNLTSLAKMILKNDVYIENVDTLWLLHWNLVKDIENSTLTNLFFNRFYPYRFTKDEILQDIKFWLSEQGIKKPSDVTLSSDIDVLLRLYKNNDVETNMNLFSDLNIIRHIDNILYSLNINTVAEISDEAFIYILLDFIETKYKNKIDSISIDELERGVLSIQKSLCISENKLYGKIYRLRDFTNNKIYYSEAMGLRQIYLNELLDKAEFLKRIYK